MESGISRKRLFNLRLLLHDPDYTDRLAAFLRSVGQRPVLDGPGKLEVEAPGEELDAYLRVWRVMHPDVKVELLSTDRSWRYPTTGSGCRFGSSDD